MSQSIDKTGNKALGQSKAKLKRSLDKDKTCEIKPSVQGYLDSIGEDICDALNEALSSKECYKLFKGSTDAGNLIEFSEVRPNQDCSHVTVLWSSDIIRTFIRELNATHGYEEAEKFSQKSFQYINEKLQKREAVFRSFLIKKIHFKRVPRVFFRPHDTDLMKEFLIKNDVRQKVLKEFSSSL
jgi:ribosome-binding factor A